MSIGSMSRRLVPMQAGGGGPRSALPPGFPTVVSPRLSRGAVWFDDFFTASVAASGVGSDWNFVQVGSGAGSAGIGPSSGTVAGILQAATGTTANDVAILEPAVRTGSALAQFNPGATTGGAGGFTVMFRCSFGATRTTCKHGFGIVNTNLALGTDWITDPDTTLGGATGTFLIIHRHTSAYGAGGTAAAAGDVVARWYDSAGTDAMVTLIAAADLGANPYNIEFHRAPGQAAIACYVDGVLKGTIAGTTSGSVSRPSVQVATETTTARIAGMDAILFEYQLTVTR